MTEHKEIFALYGAHRMKMYLAAAQGDVRLALDFYIQNLKLASDYWRLVEATEVLLRNRISDHLFPTGRVVYVEGCLWENWNRPDKSRDTFDIDEFSFGFWPFLINSEHANLAWNAGLHRSFRKKTSRARLYSASKQIHSLRNKIGHHDPVWQLDHNQIAASFEYVLKAVSENAFSWVSDKIGFPEIPAR